MRSHSEDIASFFLQSTPPEGSSASSTVSCPEGGSADDEGSREGEEDAAEREREGRRDLTVGVVQSFLHSDAVTTPRTRKRVESFKQGLAARRIQRTWKHFYEEVQIVLSFYSDTIGKSAVSVACCTLYHLLGHL